MSLLITPANKPYKNVIKAYPSQLLCNKQINQTKLVIQQLAEDNSSIKDIDREEKNNQSVHYGENPSEKVEIKTKQNKDALVSSLDSLHPQHHKYKHQICWKQVKDLIKSVRSKYNCDENQVIKCKKHSDQLAQFFYKGKLKIGNNVRLLASSDKNSSHLSKSSFSITPTTEPTFSILPISITTVPVKPLETIDYTTKTI
ncbi:hypothetical protein PVL30_004427 [Lodderomyces elongisporus]|uniref:uncharacterized protein n=1 Tax=Lodderomyces elongisporus TaxID=36914 RepID=UPI00291D02E3|nr:uncharacterized protein PVL30_004427 [Lodderomyces elongisporus]WLF80641.1 hypothetical protein PVL30_004427 [Lodderomyces elongisporus]